MHRRLRSPIQYYGGKGNMVSKLKKIVPPGGKPYCEPFCGGASLFFARDPSPVEVLNDLNGHVVNLFRCLQRKSTFEELKGMLSYTLYSRAEFERAIRVLSEWVYSDQVSVEAAWAYFVCMNQGFSGKPPVRLSSGNWSRAFTTARGMALSTSRWNSKLELLDAHYERLKKVQIDKTDALKCIQYWDTEEAIFYLDPPYVHDTRKDKNVYTHEVDTEYHKKLVKVLLGCKGKVILSGYEHKVYKPLEEARWRVVKWETVCYAVNKGRGARLKGKVSWLKHAPRTECVWINRCKEADAWLNKNRENIINTEEREEEKT